MRPESIYRALLYCYPAAFRDEFGNQMSLVFADQLGEARRSGNRFQPAILCLEAARDVLTIAPKEHGHVMMQDLRYALRAIAANPGFAAIAILSLALGIGANTAIFSLWNSLLRSSLPVVRHPEQLVMLSDPDSEGSWNGRWTSRTDGNRAWLTYGEFEQLRDRADAFSGLMASQSVLDDWRVRVDRGEPEEAHGRFVSGGFFKVLGVNPLFGRTFTEADDHADSPYAVISYNYWRRRFGGRTDVLGKTLVAGKAVLTIIGATPPGFIGETSGQQPDLWVPLRMQPSVSPGRDRIHDTPPDKQMWLNVFGRLKPGVAPAQALAQANAVFQAGLESFYGPFDTVEMRRDFLDQDLGIHFAARGASGLRKSFSSSLTALFGAVGVLLLITCANLANLFLARGAARRPEIALRLSLGATRSRLVRQLATESLVLAALGGLLGLGSAYFIQGGLARMIAQSDDTFQMSFSLSPAVLFFSLGVMLLAALLFGLFPAIQATKADAGETLKEQSRTATGYVRQMRWGRFLVSFQLALSLPLLVGAGLLAQTIYHLQHLNLGYSPERLLLLRVGPREAGYDAARRARLLPELAEQIGRTPGVLAVTYSVVGLFSGGNISLGINVEGYTPKAEVDRGSSADVVGPGYFSTLGVPILLGREILETDNALSPRVCVINEAFAKRFFDGRNAIGMHITESEHKSTCQVVGISRNARTQGLRGETDPRFYLPAAQQPPIDSPIFLIRTATANAPVLPAVREMVRRLDPELPIYMARTLEEQMAPWTAQDRSLGQLAIVFACAALALSAIGLYGVLSYGTTRRRGEIAVRVALGAQPNGIISMILRETAVLIAGGLVVGMSLAYGATRFLTSQVYGIAPQDPLTLASAIFVLTLVGLVSAYMPALRASRLDPMTALRRE
jgi:predicted permease